MLEADEVDADFFTPSTSTSLANIFKKNVALVEEEKENPSLKYIPQLPPTDVHKPEESRRTQCVFACVVQAYEWLNNSHVSRGKLGFAIVNTIKKGTNNMVLYDSKKTALSDATITLNFDINVKENNCISYYDNLRKYWTIYATQAELQNILEVLQNIGVNPKHTTETKNLEKNCSVLNSEETTTDKEDDTSNTDSTNNKKTKSSILKRMATMGQSVLPNPIAMSKNSSDSSDSNVICDKRKTNKHKHLKTCSSRNNVDKNISKIDSDCSVDGRVNLRNLKCDRYAFENEQQIVQYPVSSVVRDIPTDVKSVGNISDLSLLISEQRVSNSELRINLNKITDKLDSVLDKMRDGTKIESDSSFQNILVQKLLTEYETKIKKYEDFIKEKGFNCKNVLDEATKTDKESLLKKDNEITILQNDLKLLATKYEDVVEKESFYKNEISQLKEDIVLKNDQLIKLNKKLDNTSDNFQKSDDAKNKIKNIMNDTFQSISANFMDEENYTGSKVKNIVAVVIKKTTIEAISDM